MKFKRLFNVSLILILIIMNIGCDQVSKSVIRKNIAEFEEVEVINKHLTLTKVENTGAALGFGAKFHPAVRYVTIIILPSIFLLLMLGIILSKNTFHKTTLIALTFIIGGGIGNLLDRILYGSVTDFVIIDLGFIKTGIFNMADLSVTIGALLLIFSSFLPKKSLEPSESSH
ncbi:signal peptidase II [Flavobacteriaceae bacterium R38]|nr:signal peptidase II [Flavobacteriaceae bacterium R38]